MGLDIYSGSLTRYYARRWKTIIQQAAEAEGYNVRVERLNDPSNAIEDPEEIKGIVEDWMQGLGKALENRLSGEFRWEEAVDAPYETDKPAWDCYTSLLLFAAYSEHPELRCPEDYQEDFSSDPAYQSSRDESISSDYTHLLRDTELWLPVDFTMVFSAPDACGNKIVMGSSPQLLRQLTRLNERTWKADAGTLATWRKAGAEYQSLETGARFAFSVMYELCRFSVEHRLPLKLDY